MKDYKKTDKIYLKLSEVLYPKHGDKIEFNSEIIEIIGIYMHIKRGKDFIAVNMDDKDTKEIIQQIKEMFETKFVPIKNTCMDLIGKEVWLDKKEKHKVKFIGANGIWLENKNVIKDLDRLYIKE